MEEKEENLDVVEELLNKIDESAYSEMLINAARLLNVAGTTDGVHYSLESIIMDLFVSTTFEDFNDTKIKEYER